MADTGAGRRFAGALRIPGEGGSGLHVVVDVEGGCLSIRAGDEVLGTWSLDDVMVRSEDNGFHLKVEGEEVILATEDDGRFALSIGLKSASPRVRRLMGAALRAGS